MDDRDVTFKTIVLLLINKHSQDKLYFKEETKQNKNKTKTKNKKKTKKQKKGERFICVENPLVSMLYW